MSILITGGAGYIGSHTLVELLNQDYDVVAIDNFSNSSPQVLKRVDQITGKPFRFYQLDINDKQALTNLFKKETIEAVIHLAGYKAVGESVAQPVKYYQNNVGGTAILMEVMNQFNCKKMVFSSSATVYGLDNEPPLTEDMPLSTINPYGRTKLFIEEILQDQVQADQDWSGIILRYFNPIGAHESGLIGEDPTDIPSNIMPYISQVAIGKLDQLSIYGKDYDTPDGTGVRDYIHVVDLARGHLNALEEVLDTKDHLEIYNLGTGKGYSVLDLVQSFTETNQVQVPYQFVDRRPGDVATSYASADKAKEGLSWQAEYDLSRMVKDSWRWQKQNPNGYQAEEG